MLDRKHVENWRGMRLRLSMCNGRGFHQKGTGQGCRASAFRYKMSHAIPAGSSRESTRTRSRIPSINHAKERQDVDLEASLG